MGPCFRRDDGEVDVALRRGRRVSDSFAGQTLETARRALTARFRTNSIDSAELDARMLVGAALGLDLTGIIAAAGRPLTSDEAVRLEEFTDRRLKGEPVARILGRKEFWGLPLQLSAATLVPRPDTETVVELASPISAPAPARFCWRCCLSCRMGMGSAPTSVPPRWPRHAPMPFAWASPVASLLPLAIMRRRCQARSI
jgi:hypothetical protein